MKSLRHLVLLCLTSLTLSIQFCQSTDSPADEASSEASADGSSEASADGSSEESPADGSNPADASTSNAENPTAPPVEVQNTALNSALNTGAEESVPPENLVPPSPTDNVAPIADANDTPPPPSDAPVVDASKPEGSADESTQNAPQKEETATADASAIPELGSKMAYHIVRGDTLGLVAQKIFGDKARWKELAQVNNLKNPDQVYAGDVIFYVLDEKSKGFSEQYQMAPKKTITVQKGQSLSIISKKVYGHQGQWRSLWKMNPEIKNPHMLRVGQILNYVEWGTVSTASVESPVTKVAEEAPVTKVAEEVPVAMVAEEAPATTVAEEVKPEEAQPEVVNSNENLSDTNIANANLNTEDAKVE